jgi:hypothetical protein
MVAVPANHFGADVAARYDESAAELFEPSLLARTVDVLAELAGKGAALNAADHLEPGGYFVIEVGVPELRRLPPGETVRPFTVTATRLGFDEYDVPTQGLVSHHYRVEDGELRTDSVPFRYVWPAELDLMARLAEMSLHARWGGWDREPFTADSRRHVSVWRTDGP